MTFENALAFVLKEEGILSDNAADPGGLTKYGISSKVHPEVLDPAFSRERAIAIYRSEYWDACKCDNFPWEVGLLLFDTAVQHSQAYAIRALQMALGIAADGIVGAITIRAGWSATPQQLEDVLVFRSVHYAEQEAVGVFGRGWFRRLFHLHTEMLKTA